MIDIINLLVYWQHLHKTLCQSGKERQAEVGDLKYLIEEKMSSKLNEDEYSKLDKEIRSKCHIAKQRMI